MRGAATRNVRPPASLVPIARQQFLLALDRRRPQVIAGLHDDIMLRFDVRGCTDTLDNPPTERLPLLAAVNDWAAKCNLSKQWFVLEALRTLQGWAESPWSEEFQSWDGEAPPTNTGVPIHWGRVKIAAGRREVKLDPEHDGIGSSHDDPVFGKMPSFQGSILLPENPWGFAWPGIEPNEDVACYRRDAIRAFKQRLNLYLLAYQMNPESTQEHFDWLVERVVPAEGTVRSLGDLADTTGRSMAEIAEVTVALSLLVDVEIHGVKRGRKPGRSKGTIALEYAKLIKKYDSKT